MHYCPEDPKLLRRNCASRRRAVITRYGREKKKTEEQCLGTRQQCAEFSGPEALARSGNELIALSKKRLVLGRFSALCARFTFDRSKSSVRNPFVWSIRSAPLQLGARGGVLIFEMGARPRFDMAPPIALKVRFVYASSLSNLVDSELLKTKRSAVGTSQTCPKDAEVRNHAA